MIIPSPANPANNANTPSPNTNTPADLKNSGAYLELAKEKDVKDRSPKTGKVPSAKKNIIPAPVKNEPEESACICIDWVKPQGKKKVPNPTKIGAKVLCSTLRKKLNKLLGKVNLFFSNTPTRFNPKVIITIDAIIPKTAEKTKLIPMVCPNIPSIPPRSPKEIKRDI